MFIYKLFLKKHVKSAKVLGKHAKRRLTLYNRQKVLGKKQEFCIFFRKTMEPTMQFFFIKNITYRDIYATKKKNS